MDPKGKQTIYRAVEKAPFSQALNIELVDLELEYSASLARISHEPRQNEFYFNSACEMQGTCFGDKK
jgi:acyl-coenzyme A thioesterase PaaI-like protein